jgi:hypothetical protein
MFKVKIITVLYIAMFSCMIGFILTQSTSDGILSGDGVDVRFNPGSEKINPKDQHVIDEIIQEINLNPDLNLVITGNFDPLQYLKMVRKGVDDSTLDRVVVAIGNIRLMRALKMKEILNTESSSSNIFISGHDMWVGLDCFGILSICDPDAPQTKTEWESNSSVSIRATSVLEDMVYN